MEENFLADKPISEEKDDKFQRYTFSKRIAETILNRKSSDSIVIGLYGAWGEGKTSVLNFIREELEPHHPNVIHFTFNPWRFTDEAALLTSFFNTLAGEIKKSFKETEVVSKKTNLIRRKGQDISEWWDKKKPAANGAVLRQAGCISADSLVGIWKFVARMNISEPPACRQAAVP
jgi:predicted KAP-like P-loop ATPase